MAESANDILNFFDNFLKPGVIIKEKEVVPGFKIKLKALNIEEMMIAESIIAADKMPNDILFKVRGASTLSQAIISMNDILIEHDNKSDEENRIRRYELYKNILKMAPVLIQKIYEFYIEAVNEQNAIYNDPEKLGKDIENF